MKKILLVLLLLCLGVGQAWAGPAEDLAGAVKLILDKKNEEAKPLLESILGDATATPTQKSSAYYLSSLIEPDPTQAIALLRQSVAEDQTLERAHVRLVELLMAEKQYAEAADAAAVTLAAFPANGRVNLLSAQALSGAGRHSEAIDAFSKLLEADKKNASLYLQRGRAYQLANLQERAREDFRNATRQRPPLSQTETGDLLFYSGIILQESDKFDDAVTSYQKALSFQPSVERRAELDRRINDVLTQKRIYEETAAYRKDLDRAKDLITRRNRPQEALPLLQKLIAVPELPNDLKAQTYLYLSHTGNVLSQQIDYARKSLELTPALFDTQARLGLLLYQDKQYENALQQFTAIRATQPDNGYLLLWCGKTRMELGKYAEAIQDFTQAVQADSKFAAAYAFRAVANVEAGNYDAAQNDISLFDGSRRGRDQEASQALASYAAGRVKENQKEYSAALKSYRAALSAGLGQIPQYNADAQRRAKVLEELNAWSE